MGSNKLVLTVLFSFTVMSLTACKQGGSSKTGRTRIGKGATANGTNQKANPKTNQNPNQKLDPSGKRSQTTDTTTTRPNPADTDADDVKGSEGEGYKIGDEALDTDSSCAARDKSAKESGWKILSLDIPNEKIKITYYVLEKSSDNLQNPVIYFKQNAFQSTNAADLKKFAELYDSQKIDPVLMDMRGGGCSANEDAKTDISQSGSRLAVADAEKIRKVLLKEKKWKVLAQQSGGAVALRYAQLAPQALESIHIADFVPMADQTKLMQLRVTQENDNLKQLMKDHNVSEKVAEAALKNLESTQNCGGLKSCQTLVHLLGGETLSHKTEWREIADTLTKLADDKRKITGLVSLLEKHKKALDKNSAARIIDLDSNRSLTACSQVAKIESGLVNSCKLEVAVGLGNTSVLSNLRHEPLDLNKIKANLSGNQIAYHLFAGNLSSLYPNESSEQHEAAMGEVLETTFHSVQDVGSEVFDNAEFLDTLKN